MMRPALRLSAVAVAVLAASITGCSDDAPPRTPHLELSTEATADLVLDKGTSELAIRIRIAAGRLPESRRQPLNLVLVLDTSGSMIGDPIVATRAAALRLIDRLSPGDRFGIVAFDSDAHVIVPSTAVSAASRRKAATAIAKLEARGTTDLYAGLHKGLDELVAGRRTGTIDRIVLTGDGVPNDPNQLPHLVGLARSLRITITSLGLGMDNDEQVLRALAVDTGGKYRFLAEATEVAAVFDEELVLMREVVARNVKVGFRVGPGVTVAAIPGVTRAGAIHSALVGDLAAGEVRDVIVPLGVAGRTAGAVIELADITVTFDDVVGGPPEAMQLDAFVAARSSADPAAVAASTRLPVEIARQRFVAASAILDAIQRARAGDVAGGLKVLDDAEAVARAAAEDLKDAELAALAERMIELRRNLGQVVFGAGDVVDERTVASAAAALVEEPALSVEQARQYYRNVGVRPAGRGSFEVESKIRLIHDEANRAVHR